MPAHLSLTIPADHPAFAGHFPGNPIVPGVVLLDEALHALATHENVPIAGCTIAAGKFLSTVRPGEALTLDYEREAGKFKVSISTPDRIVATAVICVTSTVPEPARPTRVTAETAAVPADWARTAERGSQTLLRLMTWLSLRLGRAATRQILHGIALYFLLFAPRARFHARHYLSRVLGRTAGVADVYRQILTFATTVHDRVFFLNGRYDAFEVAIEGEALVRAANARGEGAFLMGAHLGSFEVIRSVGHQQVGLEVAMAMYPDNARKITAILGAINPALNADIVELGHVSAMLEIRSRLEAGSFVGMLGDRSPGGEESEPVMFLGSPAEFPTGPMRVAAMLRRPVFFIAGLYVGRNRYRVVFEPVADFTNVAPAARPAAVRAAVHAYAAIVERYCREAPYNWYNYFDFWKPRAPAAMVLAP